MNRIETIEIKNYIYKGESKLKEAGYVYSFEIYRKDIDDSMTMEVTLDKKYEGVDVSDLNFKLDVLHFLMIDIYAIRDLDKKIELKTASEDTINLRDRLVTYRQFLSKFSK